MQALFLPGIGASHREFPEYELIFDKVQIIRYKGCITLDDHLKRIDEYTNKLEADNIDYILIGHSLGANLVYHYVTHRDLKMLKGYTMIGGGPRFYPLNTWNTIFSLPSFGIALVLFFIALGAPFLFLIYGWHGMYQRVNVIDLFKREGINSIKQVYNNTLVPLLDQPRPDTSDIPAQVIRLPNDLLFPQEAMDETAILVKNIEETVINRELIHFSHHLDVLVVGHIHNFLAKNEIGDYIEKSLPFDIEYALAYPKSISVELESYEIPRLPVIIVLLLVIINGISNSFPELFLSQWWDSLIELLITKLNLEGVNGMLFGLVSIGIVFSLFTYYWLINPKFPTERQSTLGLYPKISIIVPMRNEERNIGACLSSLLNLQYPNYEIIISDGQSEDKSVEVAETVIEQKNLMNIPVKIIQEDDLPSNWVGKSWGCWSGVKQANGHYLLFTDADTSHDPESLRRVIQVVQERDLVGLSIIGKFSTYAFWEKAILPFFKTLLFIIFGGRFANHGVRTLAIGQYILVKKSVYDDFGGHEVIKSEIAEDIHLASKISENGEFMAFNGNMIYSVRMYQSLAEISEGLQRNASESVGNSLLLALIASIGLLVWRILPIITYPFIISLNSPQISLFLLGFTVFTGLLFYVDTKINDNPWYYTFIYPLGAIMLVLFLIKASLKKIEKQPRIWKGRQYL